MANVKKIPMRQCVGCREMKEKNSFIRVVLSNDNSISLDKTGKKNGRGAYICDNIECLKAAEKNKGLERSLKIQVPANVYEELRLEMVKEC